jgi:hypothetical protein
MTSGSRRGGVTSGDVLLALAVLALVAAMVHPRLERALMRHTAAAAQSDVETIRAAAAAHRNETGAWPASTEAGVVPPELVARLPERFSFKKNAYTLAWERWESVAPAAQAERPVPSEPPEVAPAEAAPTASEPRLPLPADLPAQVEVPVEASAAVTVYCPDERVLAALLDRFGAGRSFVRERSWTLVLPARDNGAPRDAER